MARSHPKKNPHLEKGGGPLVGPQAHCTSLWAVTWGSTIFKENDNSCLWQPRSELTCHHSEPHHPSMTAEAKRQNRQSPYFHVGPGSLLQPLPHRCVQCFVDFEVEIEQRMLFPIDTWLPKWQWPWLLPRANRISCTEPRLLYYTNHQKEGGGGDG